jgi:hypothetical protein
MSNSSGKRQIDNQPFPTVTVILNVFQRGANFEKQFQAVKSQTVDVREIMVWENGADAVPSLLGQGVSKSRSDSNLGVWARFAFALNATSDFVWLIDDDTIPGTRWLENALNTFATSPGVIGSRGLRFRSTSNYLLYDEFGPNFPSAKIEQVDIVGHNWIVPRLWLAHFWNEYPRKFPHHLAGEDIHLSYSIQKHLGLGTFVPAHTRKDSEAWGELRTESFFDGTDPSAISQSPKSMKRFEDAYSHYVKLGFEPLCLRDGKERSGERLLGQTISKFPHQAQKLGTLLRLRKRRRD